ILDAEGNLLRNKERDTINDWLNEHKVMFFDPQIHPETHGVEYDYALHHRVEMAARNAAGVNLYEVSPFTFGGITTMEIAIDYYRYNEPTIIYYSDGDPNQDTLPAHSTAGHPLFTPQGLVTSPV